MCVCLCVWARPTNAQDKAWDYSERQPTTYLLWVTRNPGNRRSSLGNIPATSEALADPRPSRVAAAARSCTRKSTGPSTWFERVAWVGVGEGGRWSGKLGGGPSWGVLGEGVARDRGPACSAGRGRVSDVFRSVAGLAADGVVEEGGRVAVVWSAALCVSATLWLGVVGWCPGCDLSAALLRDEGCTPRWACQKETKQ